VSAFTSGRSIDRRNRAWFFVLGLLLLALGIAGLLIQARVLTDYLAVSQPGDYYRQVRDLASAEPVWTTLALVVAGVLLIWLGIALIRRQIATPATRVRELTLQDSAEGATVVDADVLSEALAEDLERLPDVHDASARLVAAGPRPKVAVRAVVDGATDLPRLREQMEQVYARFLTVTGTDGIDTFLHLRPVPSRRRRVS
jgi:hypothetical protein